MGYLVDTNVVSELRKASRCNPNVFKWQKKIALSKQYISVITLFELRLGIALKSHQDIAAGALLLEWYQCQVKPAFAGRIIPINEHIAESASLMNVPNPRPFRDTLIAASACNHGLTVVSRNTKDFHGLGVEVVNPWVDSA